MANKNTKDRFETREENIVETVSTAEKFFNENKKCIWGSVIAVLVIGLGIFAYYNFVYEKQVAEALEQAYPAETLFANGEYELALNGDGNNLGFAAILDEYGNKAGKSMPLYAGICALQLGDYEAALSYLAKYKGKEPILAARAKACEGDAYVGLENYSKALGYFEKAAETADNMYAAGYLLKAAAVAEVLGENEKALSYYKEIKDQYPQSVEAYDVDKYIGRMEVK